MTKQEMVFAAVERLGLKPRIDDDGDIAVRYALKTFYVLKGDEDDKYVIVIFPRFHEMEEGEETLELATCNMLTRQLKLVKVYAEEDFKHVTATVEFFFNDEAALEDSLKHAFQMLGVVRSEFKKSRDELQS